MIKNKLIALFFYMFFINNYTFLKAQAFFTVVNKSDFNIDSIILSNYEKSIKFKIYSGDKFSFYNQFEYTSHSMVLFDYKVYLNNNVFKGQLLNGDTQGTDTIFVFNNGIYNEDVKPIKPKELFINFYNFSNKKLISANNSNNALLDINERSPRFFWLIFDFEKLEKDPIIHLKLNDSLFVLNLNAYKFNNWNNSNVSAYFKSDSIFIKRIDFNLTPEYVVIFEFLELDKENPGKLKFFNKSFLKSYYHHSITYNGIRAIFNFEKLKQRPIIKLKYKNKKYKIKLTEHDFSQAYYHKKDYFFQNHEFRKVY